MTVSRGSRKKVIRRLVSASFQRDICRPVSPATFRSVVAPWNGSFVRL
nr:MAG TPA: hypothetical protein [Bacteriophage sp.]